MHLLSSRFTLAHYISHVITSKSSVIAYIYLNHLLSTHLLVLLRRSFEFIVKPSIACYQEHTCVCMSQFHYGNEMNLYFLTDGNQLYQSMPQVQEYPLEINKQLGAHNFILERCGKSFLRRTHQWV